MKNKLDSRVYFSVMELIVAELVHILAILITRMMFFDDLFDAFINAKSFVINTLVLYDCDKV